MDSAEQHDPDVQRCLCSGTLHEDPLVSWLLSASTPVPARSPYFKLAGMSFTFLLDKNASTGHYGFGLELCTTSGPITPIEVKADIVVSTVDRTRRLGNQGFKANFDHGNTLYGISNILLAKTMAQEPSILFEARCYVPKTPSPFGMFWQDPNISNVVIISSNGSFAPILVNGTIVQRALPAIKETITIRAPADEWTADHHHPPRHAQSGPAMDPTSPQQQLPQSGIPLCASSPNEGCLVDLSESTVSFVAVSPPSEPMEDDGEEPLLGEPIQERRQPALNRKTRRKRQKQNQTADPDGPMAGPSSSFVGEGEEEEGAPSPSPSSSSSSTTTTTTTASSSLLLYEQVSDTAAISSEPNTPKPSPAVLPSPSPNHSTAHNKDPAATGAAASGRAAREVWLWPDDEGLPVTLCESIMRWVYFDTTTWTPPLEHFNALYAFLARLSNSTLLQAFVVSQRRAIETHPCPLTLVAATHYNDGPARVLLRPVLVAAIQKRWSCVSTGTVLASMLRGDPCNVVLDVIQSLPPPQA
ncbi:unnamed protein product [Mortierella alpina]